jgi:hypothetical protein
VGLEGVRAVLQYALEYYDALKVLKTIFIRDQDCGVIDWTFLGLSMPNWAVLLHRIVRWRDLLRFPPRSLSAVLRQARHDDLLERFLLQGGDCAESFADCESDKIAKRLKILLQMSLVLVHGLKLPVIRVGRMAGQYAKPRSADLENATACHAAELPRRHRQPRRNSRRSARARSRPAAARL